MIKEKIWLPLFVVSIFVGDQAYAQTNIAGLDPYFQEILDNANAGNADSQWRAGNMYQYGLGVERNLEVAEIWFISAVNNGYEPPSGWTSPSVNEPQGASSGSSGSIIEAQNRSMPSNASANENIIREAFGFMQFGDSGWNIPQIESGPFVNGCRVRWSQNAVIAPINSVVDFSLAKWNSATSQARLDGSVWFSVSGEGGFYDLSTDDPEMELAFFANGMVLGSKSELSFPLQTTESRFTNALRDLMNECPGISSRY